MKIRLIGRGECLCVGALGCRRVRATIVKSSRDAQGERITTGAPREECIAI
jgi:hypothetical protein